MSEFIVTVTLDDGRVVETPAIEMQENELLYEIAEDMRERHDNGTFLHIDGGDTFQRIIPMSKVSFIDITAVEEEGVDSSIDGAGRARLSLVEKPSGLSS